MDSVSEALLAQLAKGTSSFGKGRDSVDISKLPESIQKLVASLNKDIASREKAANAAKGEKGAAQKRQENIDSLQREFNSNLKELVAITDALNKTQGDSLKQEEERSRRQEALFKKNDEARKRAEEISSLESKPKNAVSGLLSDFFGAVFGKGVGDLIKNVSVAKEQTKTDISDLASARYINKIASAEETKDSAFVQAETKREDAVVGAKSLHRANLEKQTNELGEAIQSAQKNSDIQAKVETAHAAWNRERKERDRLAREGDDRLKRAVLPSMPSMSPSVSYDNPESTLGRGTLSPAMPAQAPVPVQISPLIVSPTGDDAIAGAEIAKLQREISEANTAAEVSISKAASRLQEAREGGADDRATAGYAGAIAGGEAAVVSSRNSARTMDTAIKDALLTESIEKARAVHDASLLKGQANADMESGTMVTAQEQKRFGAANMMSTAIAPPALVTIGKVMEKFRDIFPVIEQSGGALIEFGTALPSMLLVAFGQLTSAITFSISQIRDAIARPHVRARYEATDTEIKELSKKKLGKELSQADFFREAQEYNVEMAKKLSEKDIELPTDDYGLSKATTGAVVQAPKMEYTYEESPSSASGIAHVATSSESLRQSHPPVSPPPSVAENPVGVFPAAPSNGNVDDWRN